MRFPRLLSLFSIHIHSDHSIQQISGSNIADGNSSVSVNDSSQILELELEIERLKNRELKAKNKALKKTIKILKHGKKASKTKTAGAGSG